ncbi:MAG: bifunctional hydroxymethylpyrimidine kinase/phosphomethylpyrimidine kinase [Desulfopila sp.]|nr:bifunctional hydroxymethylpyrimidine kinase/phosphomethylpyrimidine kinase [Desulfopila sp.]
MKRYSRTLTIAGSDSGGGAGIQADLKTFSACGCYGMSAITAITAQNTCAVHDIHPVPAAHIAAQIRAVLDDIGADAVKIGMLHSSEVIITVAALLREYGCSTIILDPVMVATSGDRLIEDSAVDTLVEKLFPLALLITPNIPEAEILTKQKIADRDDMERAARFMSEKFAVSVLLKGGHLGGDQVVDLLWQKNSSRAHFFQSRRMTTANTHGTGCTLSSAIAAFIALGSPLQEAVERGRNYLQGALEAGALFSIGKGHGPVHHFFQQHQ